MRFARRDLRPARYIRIGLALAGSLLTAASRRAQIEPSFDNETALVQMSNHLRDTPRATFSTVVAVSKQTPATSSGVTHSAATSVTPIPIGDVLVYRYSLPAQLGGGPAWTVQALGGLLSAGSVSTNTRRPFRAVTTTRGDHSFRCSPDARLRWFDSRVAKAAISARR